MDLKTHSTYKYDDQKCRKCGEEDETVVHIINCKHNEELDLDYMGDPVSNMVQTVRCLKRIENFIDDMT